MKLFLNRVCVATILLIVTVVSAFSDVDEQQIKKDLPMLLGSNNQGTEFLLTFHPCWESSGNSNEIKIYVASAVTTNVTLTIEALGYVKSKVCVPNEVLEFGLSPTTAQMYSKDDSQKPQPQRVYVGRACIVTSDEPIVVYGVTRYQYTSDGFLALPITALGKEYVVSSWNDPGEDNGSQYLTSYTSIVAAYDKTKVSFTLGGRPSGFTPGKDKIEFGDRVKKRMDKGDVWLIGVVGDYNDLSGSHVKANKPVAVISGSFCAFIPIGNSACDFIIEQDLPMETWGYKYHVTQIVDRKYGSMIRVYASEPNTYIYRGEDPWAKLTTVGGTDGSGYLNRRVVATEEETRPVVISSDKRISVTQYNPGQTEDGIESDPFQMVLTPMEQYQNKILFCTPGVNDGVNFKRNYINLCYKSTEKGQIPKDMEYGVGRNGTINWQALTTVALTAGTSIYDPSVTDGRDWKSLTLTLGDPSAIYGVRGETPFSAYGYGFDRYDSYGWPVAVALADLSVPDIWTPSVDWSMDCFGSVSGESFEEPRGIDSLRSNFNVVRLLKSESNNFVLEEIEDFFPGETKFVEWRMHIENPEQDAKAAVYFADRAGNDTTIYIEYYRTKFKYPPFVNWGQAAYDDDPITKEISFTNDSEHSVMVDSVIILGQDKDREWDESGFRIDPAIYESGMLPGLEVAPGEKVTFNVTFNPALVVDDIIAGHNAFVDSVGLKAYYSEDVGGYCYYKYHTAVKSTTGTPVISVQDINFGAITVNSTSPEKTATISNLGNSDLKITGATGPDGLAAKIYEVVRLGQKSNGDPTFEEISESNPLIIKSGSSGSKLVGVVFTPNDVVTFDDEIIFISDSDEHDAKHDPVLKLTGRGIKPGIKTTGHYWEKVRTNIIGYRENPNSKYDSSTFPYNTNDSTTGKPMALEIENTGNQVFTITDVKILEDSSTVDYEKYFFIESVNNQGHESIKTGLKNLIEGKVMDITDNKTRMYPVTFNPLVEGHHKVVVQIIGEQDGVALEPAISVFEGNAYHPKASVGNYNFTENEPDGTAIVGNPGKPYFEKEIVFKAENWGDYADPVRIYEIRFEDDISLDINTPGSNGFAVDGDAINAMLADEKQNPVAPGEDFTFNFNARFYPVKDSPNNGLDDFVTTVTYVTDAESLNNPDENIEFVSEWRARSITQGATTTGNTIETCVNYPNTTEIAITNTASDILEVTDVVWTDNFTIYNDGNERFKIADADKVFSVNPGETHTVQVEFSQSEADPYGQNGTDQVFEFITNIEDPNITITATIHTEVTSYPRETYAKINGDEHREVSFESGGDKITYELTLGTADNNMDYVTEKTDFTIKLFYDGNFMGAETKKDGDVFKPVVKLGSGLNKDDYTIKSTRESILTANDLKEIENNNPDLFDRIKEFMTNYNVLPKYLTVINIEIENNSGNPINSRDPIQLMTLDFKVALNHETFVSDLGGERPKTSVVHHVATNESCLVPEYRFDPTLSLKEVCAENLRLIDMNTDANGNVMKFELHPVNPNPVGAEGADINYEVAFDCQTTITIFDETGSAVAVPVNENVKFGQYSVAVPVDKLSSGVYFIEMKSGPFTKVTQLVIEK